MNLLADESWLVPASMVTGRSVFSRTVSVFTACRKEEKPSLLPGSLTFTLPGVAG